MADPHQTSLNLGPLLRRLGVKDAVGTQVPLETLLGLVLSVPVDAHVPTPRVPSALVQGYQAAVAGQVGLIEIENRSGGSLTFHHFWHTSTATTDRIKLQILAPAFGAGADPGDTVQSLDGSNVTDLIQVRATTTPVFPPAAHGALVANATDLGGPLFKIPPGLFLRAINGNGGRAFGVTALVSFDPPRGPT